MTKPSKPTFNVAFLKEGKCPNCGYDAVSDLTGWCYNHQAPVVNEDTYLCGEHEGGEFIIEVKGAYYCTECDSMFDNKQIFDWNNYNMVGSCPVGEEVNENIFEDFGEFEPTNKYYDNAKEVLLHIKSLTRLIPNPTDPSLPEKNYLTKILYGSTVATLESFLGDAFKFQIFNCDKNLKKFVSNYKPLQKEVKFELVDMLKFDGATPKTIKEFVVAMSKAEISKIIFHNLTRVYELYHCILGVTLPPEWKNFIKPVENRHHIFHRAGKDLEGNPILITKQDLEKLISDTEAFIDSANVLLSQRKVNLQA